jgi:callose synthase
MLLFILPSGNCFLMISVTCAAVLDVILSWKSQQSMSFHVKLRYILKVVSAAAWVVVLPVTYAYTWENPPGFAQTIKSWFGNSSSSPSLFILAVVIYLSPNMLAAILFLFPFIRRFLERSNYKIVMLMMWWSQVCNFFFLLFCFSSFFLT